MKFVLEFTAVFIAGVLNHTLGTFFYIKNPDYPKLFTASEQLLRRWLSAMAGITVVLLVAMNQPNGFASIGIHTENGGNNRSAIFWAWLAVSALMIVCALTYRLLLRIRKEEVNPTLDTSRPWIAESMRYRNGWERSAYLTVLPLEVISEDLVYRGYFVLLLGNRTGTFILWAIISVILSVIIHLYQGRDTKTVIFHFISAIFLVGLTIITQNIFAPITAHLYYNLIHTTQTWSLAKKQGTPMPEAAYSGKKKIAYIIFIGVNIILLCGSMIWVLS